MTNNDVLIDPVEKRKYSRLKYMIAVDFSIVRLQGDLPGVDWQQGHTWNVSKGGLCLESELMNDSIIRFLSRENIYLDLRIHLPFQPNPIKAVGEIVWHKKDIKKTSTNFIIGLKFRSIINSDLKTILCHAQEYRDIKPIVIAVLVVLFGLAILVWAGVIF